ncbi:MAG: hypothetical protein CMJ48_00685 [Planctomycetaceae bacterium]|nr:hypothetical protein [Planctomycetaceae bacterium]
MADSHAELAELPESDQLAIEQWLLSFDQDWKPGKLEHFLGQAPFETKSLRHVALEELVKVDLELQWRAGHDRRLEDYLAEHPELGDAEHAAPALILAEYEAAREANRPLELEALLRRFPKQADQVRAQVTKSDAQYSRITSQQSVSETLRPRDMDADSPQFARPENWSLGSRFGRYKIEKRLGEGAMGSVYLAHDTELDRKIALKIPKFGEGDNQELVERFFREARAAATLRHANICPVHDVGEIDDTYYISMAYIEGRPLSDYISPEKLQGEREIAILVRKLALKDAHENGVVHRDLKPDNIMIDAKNEPVIMDFGLARQTDKQDQSRVTQSGVMLGTPAYMSPEQVEGELDVGPQSDLYSLGVILFELCTARLPFEGGLASVLGQIIMKEPPKPSEYRPELDERLETICLKMMAKQPAQRFATMKAAADELTRFIKGEIPKPVEKTATLKPDDDAPSVQRKKREEKSTSVEAPRKTLDPRIEQLKSQKAEIESLLDQNQHARAVRLLEAMLKQTAPQAKKYVEWAKKQLPRAKADPERIRRESDSAVRTAKKLISRHEFLQAAEMLQQIPEHLRSAEVTKTLERAIELADEVEYLIKDIEDAERKREFEGLLPSVERLLTLKPANKLALRLHEELTTYGKGGKFRVGGEQKVYHMGGLAIEAWKIWGSVALIAAIFGGAYAYSVFTISIDGQLVKVEIADGYEDQVIVKLDGKGVIFEGDGFGEVRVNPGNKVQFEIRPKGGASFEVVKDSVRVADKTGQILRITFVDDKPTVQMRSENDRPSVQVAKGGDTPGATGSASALPSTTSVSTNVFLSDQWEWAKPVKLGPEINTERNESDVSISADGLTLAFESNRPGGLGGLGDVWISERNSESESWSVPKALGPSINTRDWDGSPHLSANGLTLTFFSRGRPGSLGFGDLWESRRNSRSGAWGEPVNLGPNVNSAGKEYSPMVSADGLTLVFHGERAGGHGSTDLWMSRRTSMDAAWGKAVNLGTGINSPDGEYDPALSPDGLTLLYAAPRNKGKRGSERDIDIFMTTRPSVNAAFGRPVSLGPAVNSEQREGAPSFSGDGRTIYFESRRDSGDDDLYSVTRVQKAGGPQPAVAPFDVATAQKHQRAWASYLGLPVEQNVDLPGGKQITMVLVPPGEFLMGSSASELTQFLDRAKADKDQPAVDRIAGEAPQHRVRITEPFYLGKHEVTQDQWQSVTGNNPSRQKSKPSNPVEMVSWDDIQPFLGKLNQSPPVPGAKFALPTEAQWEYACRAGTTTIWNSGDNEAALPEYAWIKANAGGKTQPVAQLKPNAWGLYGMHGNVWEWCADRLNLNYYKQSPTDDPSASSGGTNRVLRGGAWRLPAEYARSAHRFGMSPARTSNNLGFRLAMTIDAPKPSPTTASVAKPLGTTLNKTWSDIASPNWQWSPSVKIESVSSSSNDSQPTVSQDQLSMIFGSRRPGSNADYNLWESRRTSASVPWPTPVELEALNTDFREFGPALSGDGLNLVFSRNDAEQRAQLWSSTRDSLTSPWKPAKPLASEINGDYHTLSPSLSADGLVLVYERSDVDKVASRNLWISERASIDAPWQTGVKLENGISSDLRESTPNITPDGLGLLFSRNPGQDGRHWYLSQRTTRTAPWSNPEEFDFRMEGFALGVLKQLIDDGQTIYFSMYKNRLWDIYSCKRIPRS